MCNNCNYIYCIKGEVRMNTKNSILSIVAATLLVNCGGGGGNSDTSADEIAPRAVVCLDANSNSICEENEQSEKVNSWEDYGDYRQNKSINAKALNTSSPYPLAYNSDNNLTLRAVAGSTSITPFSTVIYYAYEVDKLYDTLKQAQEATARDFPNINESAEFSNGLKQAIFSNQDEQTATIVGAYINELRKKGLDNIADVSIDKSSIQSYRDFLVNQNTVEPVDTNETAEPTNAIESSDTNTTSEVSPETVVNPSTIVPADTSNLLTNLTFSTYFEGSVEDTVVQMENDSWRNATHSRFESVSSNGSKVVFGARRHNSLSIIDLNDKRLKYNSFGALKDAGRGHRDSVTRASENYIKEVHVTKDNYIYTNIDTRKSYGSHAHTYGLFKTKINADDTVRSYMASLRIPEKLEDFTLSPSEKVVFTYDKYKDMLIAYDNEFTKIASFETRDVEIMAAYDDNTIYSLAGGLIHKFTVNGDTFKEDNVTFTSPIDNPKFMQLAKNKIVLTNYNKQIGVVNIDNNETNSTNIGDYTSRAAVSADGNYLATLGSDLVITNLNLMKIQSRMKKEDSGRTITFVGNNKIAFSSGDYDIKIVNISDTGKIITPEDKIKVEVAEAEKQINNGESLVNITNSLNLISKSNGVIFDWNTSISDELNVSKDENNVTSGKITRPNYTDSDATGTLTLTATGFGATYEKTYDITIKKLSTPLPTPIKTEIPSLSYSYFATNADGTKAIKVGRNSESKYVISSFTVDSNGSLEQVENNATYGDSSKERFKGVGVSGSHIVALTRTSSSVGRIYSVKIHDDGSFDNNVTSSQDISTGEVYSLNLNKSRTKAVVLVIKKASFSAPQELSANIYDISSSGVLSLADTVELVAGYGYKSDPITINDKGDEVYHVGGKMFVRKKSTDGSESISKKVDLSTEVMLGANRVFVMARGIIYSYNSALADEKKYTIEAPKSSYQYAYMKIGGIRQIDGQNYLFVAVKGITDAKSGIYKLKILGDGSLEEAGFIAGIEYYNKLVISEDGKKIFFFNDTTAYVIQ